MDEHRSGVVQCYVSALFHVLGSAYAPVACGFIFMGRTGLGDGIMIPALPVLVGLQVSGLTAFLSSMLSVFCLLLLFGAVSAVIVWKRLLLVPVCVLLALYSTTCTLFWLAVSGITGH
jgi:hypothetical protein